MFGLVFGASLPTRSWATNNIQNEEVKAKEARKVIVTKRRIIFGRFSSWSKTRYFLWFELCFPTQVKQNYRKIRLSEAAHSRETFDARKGINHMLSWENQCTSLWTPSRIRFHYSLNMLTKSWVNGLWPATYFYLYRVKQPKKQKDLKWGARMILLSYKFGSLIRVKPVLTQRLMTLWSKKSSNPFKQLSPFLKTILKENWMTDLLKLTGQTVAKLLKFKQPVLYIRL